MLTALDTPVEKLDEHELRFVSLIREHGWFATHVFGEGNINGFSYSTGFYLNLGHPEVIIFSLKREIAHDVLWSIYRDVVAGQRFSVGVPVKSVFANSQAAFFNVAKEHYHEHLGWSSWFYRGQEFPCIQLVWTDRQDRFPWDTSFDQSFAGLQSDLSANGWNHELTN